MNIDIHCHSSSKPVMKETNDPKNEDYLKQLLTGFTFGEDTSSRRKINSLVETVSGVYMNTQSHFDSLYEGDIRIACISLTPMEVGFNIINKDKNKIGLLNDLLRKLYTKKRSQYLISPKLINALTGYDLSSIEYVQDGMRDYYEGLLLKEYNYLMEFDNTTRTINNKTYTIRFPKNKTELNRNLAEDKYGILNIILTIEGMHSLMAAPHLDSVFNGQYNRNKQTDGPINEEIQQLLSRRIYDLKNTWKVRPLFISMMHHFWNGLGGHALSLGRTITQFVSQQEGLNVGMTSNGIIALKELLLGTPIYIDIKHMSPICRQTYYQLLKNDKDLKRNSYPIICSHTGIAPIDSVQDLVSQIPNESKIQNDKNAFLFKSGINVCREEIDAIIDSNGILGIQLDEKRIAGKKTVHTLKDTYRKNIKLLYVKLIWANIFEAVRMTNRPEAWDIIAIGSDYDGLINHLDPYPISADIKTLREDMLNFLLDENDEIVEMDFSLTRAEINQYLFNYNTPAKKEKLVAKIFEDNALAFLKTWYV